MRFYCYKEGDSFQIFKEKVEIVEQLLYPPASISMIESNHQNNGIGKKAAREIVQSTTDSLVLIVILSTSVFVFSHELNIRPIWSVTPFIFFLLIIGISKIILGYRFLRETIFTLWFILAFFIAAFICSVLKYELASFKFYYLVIFSPFLLVFIIGVFLIYFRRDKLIKNFYKESLIKTLIDKYSTKDNISSAEKNEIDNFFKLQNQDTNREEDIRFFAIFLAAQKKPFWIIDRVITTVPFSLRNIWLWSLIIGVCTIYINEKYQVLLGSSIDNKIFLDFSSDFLRVLLIAVVSYIATNIISELLQLREQYVQGRDEMKTLSEIINKSKKDFNQIAANAEYLVGTNSIRAALKQLRDKVSENIVDKHPLDSVFKSFTDTISDQFMVIKKQVKENDLINLWIISSLNQYFKVSSEELNKNSSITTKFQSFGKILKETFEPILQNEVFLNKFKKDYEIFTVLVIPPKRFLNYDENGTKRNNDWNQFILSCILSKNKELKINRHFLTIDPNGVDQDFLKKKFGEESIDLQKNSFQQQLKDEYYFSTDNNHSDQEIIYGTNDSFPKYDNNKTITGYERKSLSYILDKLHFNNSCKVIEITIPTGASSDSDKLNIFSDILWDTKTDKTLDYFAIRETGNKEWLFCFKTVVDKSFDFAHIEIHHKKEDDHSKWNKICENLNKVFLTNMTPDEDGRLENNSLGIKICPIIKYQ